VYGGTSGIDLELGGKSSGEGGASAKSRTASRRTPLIDCDSRVSAIGELSSEPALLQVGSWKYESYDPGFWLNGIWFELDELDNEEAADVGEIGDGIRVYGVPKDGPNTTWGRWTSGVSTFLR